MTDTGRRRPSVAIVGGGFGGVGAAVMLRRQGYDITGFDRGERLGGTWYFNNYPGLTCDVPSSYYQFSFAPNPDWSRGFAPRDEIQEYLEDVARREGVAEKFRLGTEVKRAVYDNDNAQWTLETSNGSHRADFLLTACGQLSAGKAPQIPGAERFTGPAFHTARWRHDVDLAGKRVAVIGTGASAIQVVPHLQKISERVDVYQRSAPWVLPKMDRERKPQSGLRRRLRIGQRLERLLLFTFFDLFTWGLVRRSRLILGPVKALARANVRRQVPDRGLRAKVMPSDEIGCKRILITSDWYPALSRDNVELVTDQIEEITERGIRTADGAEREVDAIVYATGYLTHEFVAPMEVIGRGGRKLAEEWGDLARAYLGSTVPGFPNMFILYGPNTNGNAVSAVYLLESGIRHALAAIRTVERERARAIEVRPEAAAEFDRELRKALPGTVWHTGCTSWYLDEEGNNPNQWPWTFLRHRRRSQQIDRDAYTLEPAET